jgi:oxygen-independent coproporphyrinogen-3 oxidase
LRIKTYVERLTDPAAQPMQFPFTPATVNRRRQTAADDMGEFMMTGLRLTSEGVGGAEFRARFGADMQAAFGHEISELTRLGLLEQAEDRVRLTRRGRLLGNQVFVRFVGGAAGSG